jgi:hypothetical protein
MCSCSRLPTLCSTRASDAGPASFIVATGIYSFMGGCITYYNTWRASHDPSAHLNAASFRPVIALNFLEGLEGMLKRITILRRLAQM